MAPEAADIPQTGPPQQRPCVIRSPFLRAPESARTVFLVMTMAACVVLAGGVFFFGWRALLVAGVCVLTSAVCEGVYARASRQPVLVDRAHGYLTGLLLALTLPAFVPLWVAAVASAVAIWVGKAVFGGVGHFVWQPALVGRLAVAVLLPGLLSPGLWPLLTPETVVVGDIREARLAERDRPWEQTPPPPGADATLHVPPSRHLQPLTRGEPAYTGLVYARTDMPRARPAALRDMPPLGQLIYGARPGGIGETAVVLIAVAGLYLVYQGYVRWYLPVVILLAAWITVAVAPVQLLGPGGSVLTVWLPLTHEGLDAGVTYVNYQLLTSGIFLAAFFLAPETTSRPLTPSGQLLFGIGCGTGAMLLRLYGPVPIPAYAAVLAMNTFTPAIDSLCHRRPLGQRHLYQRILHRNRPR